MADKDTNLIPFNHPLNGRVITKLDPSIIPDAHFQALENFGYNDGGIEPLKGMTKINASALAKIKVQNGFHFKKSIPVEENHVFVQASDATTSAIYKSDNTADIPDQDTFTLFKALDSTNTVYFTEAPDQSMVFCDGYHNYIYSGAEYRAAKVINFDPGGTFSYDYTKIANNNLTSANNVFTMSSTSGGVDTSCKAIWHFNSNLTDGTTNAHDLTGSGTPTYTTGRFGNAVKLVAASTQYAYIADHADFDFSGNVYTIDGVFNVTSLAAVNPIYYQRTAADDDSFNLYIHTDGSIKLVVKKTAEATFTATTPAAVVTAGTTCHIAVVQNSTVLYIFVDGVIKFQGTAPTTIANFTGNVQIGYDNAVYYGGWIDELRISNNARWTNAFNVPVAAYSGATIVAYLYVGSTRPIDGIKFYVNVANTASATATGYYWSGSAFTACTTPVDGTSSGGNTLAQTGTLSFDSTVSTCKVKTIKENIAYYYQVVFSGIDATTEISQITVSCPVQDVVDIWDGTPRQIYSMITYVSSAYADVTENVYDLEYDAADATTYTNIGAMTTTDYVYMGFNERLLGMKFYFGGTSVNTNSAIMYVDYWNGLAWTTVGAIDDGMSVSGKAVSRSGVVTWNAPSAKLEYINSVGNSAEWFYYRVHFSATLSATVRLDHVTGIPVQADIPAYRYPVIWNNRLWLLNDQTNNKNTALGSSYGTVCVFNGNDSGVLSFGGSKELNCGKTLFTRYGGSLYENLIACKNNETYLVDGTSFSGDGAFVVYQVSSTRGCIAPLTMKQCDIGYEVAPGVTKHIVTWLSNSGLVMFDSNSMIEISGDIGDRFYTDGTYSINRSISDKSAGFYDSTKGQYHLLIPVGSSSTYLNEEWMYDVVRKKLSLVNRGAKYLWCGFEVEDAQGNQYVYGGTGDGFIERLDYGTTFDGVGIAYKIKLSDSLLNQSWEKRKEIRQIKLIGKCKTTTTQKIAIYHYADGCTTASTPTIPTMSNNKSGSRIFKYARSCSFRGTTHCWEFTITTTDEEGGFEPLYVAGLYRTIDNDVEEE